MASSLGWMVQAEPPGRTGSTPIVVAERSGSPATLVANLARLIEVGISTDWWLERLSVCELAPEHAAVSVVFTAGRRVLTSRATSASAERRRAAGRRSGRKPSLIAPELLERIAEARRPPARTYRSIAAELEASGVPTPSGHGHWYASTVRAAHLRLLAAD